MGFPILQQEQIFLFTLIFLRIGAMLIMIPVLGEKTVPARIKAGLTLLISVLVFQSVRTGMTPITADLEFFSMVSAIGGEIMIGLIIGFTAKIIFAGIQFAGDIIGVQMGFSIVNVIDPLSSTQVSILSEFQYLIALLVYLAVDAHHLFILAIVDSYRTVSPFGFHFSGSLMQSIFMFSGLLFVTAVKVSAPVMAILLFTNVALAVIARTVPQINVFIVGFPLQIAAGLVAVGLTVPVFVQLVQRAIAGLGAEVQGLLQLM